MSWEGGQSYKEQENLACLRGRPSGLFGDGGEARVGHLRAIRQLQLAERREGPGEGAQRARLQRRAAGDHVRRDGQDLTGDMFHCTG